jgi:hypothetical protein
VQEQDLNVNIQNVTCHELVHACSAPLRLPAWLNEGIAVFTTDRFMGKPVVRPETLNLVKNYTPKAPPPTYRELSRMDKKAIAYHGIRGYWIVCYMEEKSPGFFRRMFSRRQDMRVPEHEMAMQLGIEEKSFWTDIDEAVVNYFNSQNTIIQ